MGVVIPREKSKLNYDLYFDNSNELGSRMIEFYAKNDNTDLKFGYANELKLISTNRSLSQEEIEGLNIIVDLVKRTIDVIKFYLDKEISDKSFVLSMTCAAVDKNCEIHYDSEVNGIMIEDKTDED